MNIFKKVEEICQKSKIASKKLSLVNSYEKNKGLEILSKNILSSYEEILLENKKDLEKAKKNSLSSSLINRLTLTSKSLDSFKKGSRNFVISKTSFSSILNFSTVEIINYSFVILVQKQWKMH